MAARSGTRIGIALGDTEAVAVVLGKEGAPFATVKLSLGTEGVGPGADIGAELLRAFRELKAELEKITGGTTEGARAFVGLLPPLADARLITLPPMRKAEAEAVLSRDVARHFLGANRPRTVGIRLPRRNGRRGRGGRGIPAPVFAAAAPLALLEAAHSALGGAGWQCDSFSAAHGTWLKAAAALKGTPVTSVLAVVGPTAHLLRVERGDPVVARQVSGSDPSGVVKALGSGPGRVLVLAGSTEFEEFRGPLGAAGFTPVRDTGERSRVQEVTASFAGSAELELVPPSLASHRKEKGRRTAMALGAGAVALILATLGAQMWGVRRELEAVQAERASIRAEVAPLLLARDSLNGLVTQVQSMAELSSNSPVWTRSLVELAALLPMDTYLTGFFASGDTVEIEAAGAQAGEAIQALREAGLFQEIRLQGVVERDMEDGETVVERFRLWGRLPPAGKGDEGS